MAIDIEVLDSENTNYTDYIVTFFNNSITTTVTHDPGVVSDWISEIEHTHRYRLNHLVVGLDVEWRPNTVYYTNPVATLQLCVGRRCLIYQLIHTRLIPRTLVNFLADEDYTFVGVGIHSDLEKLEGDYEGLGSNCKAVDLRCLIAEEYRTNEFERAGLRRLASVVMGVELDKPEWVTRSRWDYRYLTDDQVQYACVDAFVSFEIGRILNASSFWEE